MADPFITAAANFESAVSGGVDPRTCLYNINIALGKVLGNRGLGPQVPLTLRYSPLNTIDFGFGVGCALGFSVYRVAAGLPRLLMVSTGEQYTADSVDQLRQQKLKSFMFLPDRTANVYRIVHKDGSVEILQPCSKDYYVPGKLLNSTGHALTLTWADSNGMPELQSIVDDSGTTLLKAQYGTIGNARYRTLLSVLPNSSTESCTVDMTFDSNLLEALTIDAQGVAPRTWNFDRTILGQHQEWGTWLTGMKGPGGFQESVNYNTQSGMRFPVGPNAGLTYPCVDTYTRKPQAGQPFMVTGYTHSDNNYLGYGTGLQGNSFEDTLLGGPFTNFTYTTTETPQKDSNTIVITRTYNSYHLLSQTKVERNVPLARGELKKTRISTTTTDIKYDLALNKYLSDQPAWYQLPTGKTITWQCDARTRVQPATSATWDVWGNQLSRTDPDGLLTTWVYYPSTGSGQDCPKDPYGFVRFVQSQTVDPTKMASVFVDEPIRKVMYKYVSLACVPGSTLKPAIVKSWQAQYSGTVLLSTAQFDYYTNDTNAARDTGRLKQRISTHRDAGQSDTEFSTLEVFKYEDDPQLAQGIKLTRTLTAHYGAADALTIGSSTTSSRFTNRAWKEIDARGNVQSYNYDPFGRVTQYIWNPGTSYENFQTYEYFTDDDGRSPFQVIQTDILGNKVRETFDAMGRQVRREVNSVDTDGSGNIWHTQEEKQYDVLGRLTVSTVTDQQDATTYTLHETLEYDVWGQASRAVYDDGLIDITLHDPISMTVAKGQSSSGKIDDGPPLGTVVTTYDLRGKPTQVNRYRAGIDSAQWGPPYSTSKQTYDRLSRLRAQTDERNNTSKYFLDDFDRVIETILPDDSTLTRYYSQDTSDATVTAIWMNGTIGRAKMNVCVGTRKFDALGRLTDKNVGGRQWSYTYASPSATKPHVIDPPAGGRRTYEYIPELDEKVTSLSVDGVGQVRSFNYYTYTKATKSGAGAGTTKQQPGAIKQASAGPAEFDYVYHPSGRMRYEQSNFDGVQKSAQYSYTVGGKLTDYIHVDNTLRQTQRDPYGRISKVFDANMSVTLDYDPLGRLWRWTSVDEVSHHQVKTELRFDEFERETERKIIDQPGGHTWRITQDWYEGDLLQTRRVYLDASDTPVREETYFYGKRNELTRCTFTGTAAPSDRYGTAMEAQNFDLDALGNITSVFTTFVDQSFNQATFHYDNAKDPCQLTSVGNTHPNYPALLSIRYDDAGRMLDDGAGGHSFQYDALGLMSKASNTKNSLSGGYGYDPYGRLYKQTRADQADPMYFYYRANQLVDLAQGSNRVRLLRSPAGATSQFNFGKDAGTWLLGTDRLGSVLSASDGRTTEEHRYSPYGEENQNG